MLNKQTRKRRYGEGTFSNHQRTSDRCTRRTRATSNGPCRGRRRQSNEQSQGQNITKNVRSFDKFHRRQSVTKMVKQSDEKIGTTKFDGNGITNLSTEMVRKIFSFLRLKDLKLVNLVNKRFHIIVKEIIFTYPSIKFNWFETKFKVGDIYGLPIQILKTSSIPEGPFLLKICPPFIQ